MNSPLRIAIVGGGFCGTMSALQLLRQRTHDKLEISLIEKDPDKIGLGLAYSPPSERFLLNVRAHTMGAWPDTPEDFFHWLESHGYKAERNDFVPRAWYGKYLQDLLFQQKNQVKEMLQLIPDEVTDIHRIPPEDRFSSEEEFCITFAQNPSIKADIVILALGNLEKTRFEKFRVSDFFVSPYQVESYQEIDKLKKLFVVGSGLTAVDFILEAEGRGFQGSYAVLSRHGRFPVPHDDSPPPSSLVYTSGTSLRGLIHSIHMESRRLGTSQTVIEGLRPYIQNYWNSFSDQERRRFLRHVQSLWTAHRHRIPKSHSTLLAKLMNAGRMQLFSGRIRSIEKMTDGLQITYDQKRHIPSMQTSQITDRFDRIALCVGPESNILQSESPLLARLIEHGMVAPGSLRLGADISLKEQRSGKKSLFLLGPLQKESLWEITAVRELRVEAEKVAKEVLLS